VRCRHGCQRDRRQLCVRAGDDAGSFPPGFGLGLRFAERHDRRFAE
jgi:hypothetical protein